MSERLFGAHVRRLEDPRLITGRGRYVADVVLPGCSTPLSTGAFMLTRDS